MRERSFDHYSAGSPGRTGAGGAVLHRTSRHGEAHRAAGHRPPGLARTRIPTIVGGRPHRGERGRWTASCARRQRRVLDRLLREEDLGSSPRGQGDDHLRPLLLLRCWVNLPQPRVHARRLSPTGKSTTRMTPPTPPPPGGLPEPGLPGHHHLPALATPRGIESGTSYSGPAGGGASGADRPASSGTRCGVTTRSAHRRDACRALVGPFLRQRRASGTSGDEHPQRRRSRGPAFSSDVVHAFLESPQWKNGIIFVVYDEWGGRSAITCGRARAGHPQSSDPAKDFGLMVCAHTRARDLAPYARRGVRVAPIFGLRVDHEDDRVPLRLDPLTRRDAFAAEHRGARSTGSRGPRLDPSRAPGPRRRGGAHCFEQGTRSAKEAMEPAQEHDSKYCFTSWATWNGGLRLRAGHGGHDVSAIRKSRVRAQGGEPVEGFALGLAVAAGAAARRLPPADAKLIRDKRRADTG